MISSFDRPLLTNASLLTRSATSFPNSPYDPLLYIDAGERERDRLVDLDCLDRDRLWDDLPCRSSFTFTVISPSWLAIKSMPKMRSIIFFSAASSGLISFRYFSTMYFRMRCFLSFVVMKLISSTIDDDTKFVLFF
ncbi:hypothetical protein BLNAU_2915 [Blattamonas nauphoetae]|uniref:Uncharacterized protein n=1 Tax=Blattamonas nauphoetae TaxID=2049346 RepID=A0ABQ9YF21_9EUKA|nr:hypothetical protein BLNAU_2915 [Blattamonas nauphoetae]